MPKVSYIILSRNSQATLEDTLESIKKQSLSKEIILVDTDSTDQTLAIARRYRCIIVKDFSRNLALCRSMGVSRANGQYIAFTDSDIILPDNWDKSMISHIGKGVIGATGVVLSSNPVTIPKILDQKTMSSVGKVRNVTSIPTSNAMYEGDILRKYQFDYKFSRAGEDLELNLRLYGMGYEFIQDGNLIALHHHPETLGELFSKYFNYGKFYIKAHRKKSRRWDTKTYTFRVINQIGLLFSLLAWALIPLGYLLTIYFLLLPYLINISTSPRYTFIHGFKESALMLGSFREMILGVD